MARTHPVYVVDDDPGVHDWVLNLCEDKGLACRGFASGDKFLANAAGLEPGCVLLDMKMPRRNGLEVQAELARLGLPIKVVAMTGYGDVETAVQSMKLGAVDFLEKPFPTEVLMAALTAAFKAIDEQGE